MGLEVQRQSRKCLFMTLVAVALSASPRAFAADAAPQPTPVSFPVLSSASIVEGLSADTIVERLMLHNEQRAAALRGFDGRRVYQLAYHGFAGGRDAQMEVVAHYEAPQTKNFDVVSESGSKAMQNRVFSKLLQSEREASTLEVQRSVALSPENYRFTLLGTRPSPYGGCYRLAVEPKRDDKFLYRGEICVNAADYAVESIDAEPAKNPSFWIKKTRIEHRYQKIGEFWLPAFNKTITSVRLGGTATLSIDYTGYELR